MNTWNKVIIYSGLIIVNVYVAFLKSIHVTTSIWEGKPFYRICLRSWKLLDYIPLKTHVKSYFPKFVAN